MNHLPPLPSVELGRYRHYKGGEYEVLGVVRHSESLEPLVLYRPLYNQTGLWVRPWTRFLEPVEFNGKTQPRFGWIATDACASETELAATVSRMEASLSASEDAEVKHLMGFYRQAAGRFERDGVACSRDVHLAKAGALMLVQAASRPWGAPGES